MPGPLDGVRVIEFSQWLAGPAAGAILADWGAEVIKIEPPAGDPLRGLYATAFPARGSSANPAFDQTNRGKRSVALDASTPEGRQVLYDLVRTADVFLTNFRPRALRELKLTYEELSALNPRLVYCHITGYGLGHEQEDRPSYDYGAFWSRSSVAASMVPLGAPPPHERSGIGDHSTGCNAAGAIVAALFQRERTGRGQKVGVSLLRVGAYLMGWDLMLALHLNLTVRPYDRQHAVNPLLNCYRAKDGRWFWLLLLQADRHWPDLCRAIGRPDLQDDPRFRDIQARRQNGPELVAILDEVFAQKTLDEWGEIFERENVWWDPVNTANDVLADPLAHKAGVFVEVPVDGETTTRMVATPADFYTVPWGPRGPAPEMGQHTEEVLLELGYDWDRIIALKEKGAIP